MRLGLFLRKKAALLLSVCLLFNILPYAQADVLTAAPISAAEGAANGMVRVYLSSLGQRSQLHITIDGSYSLDGTAATALPRGSTVTVGFSSATGQLTLTRGGETVSMGSDFRLRRHAAEGTNGVRIRESRVSSNVYPGDLQFKSVRSGGVYRLYTIAHVFIEDYLCGVLPYEMGNASALEALKAQCVSARTYTVRAMQSAGSRSYDLVDTTNDQVYNGTPSGNARCRQAVEETRGIVAMNGNAFTATYYTASNGGQIESVRNIWGSAGYDYIRVKEDPYDYQNPYAEVRTLTVYGEGAQKNGTLQSLLLRKARQVFDTENVILQNVLEITPHTPRYAAPSRLYTKLDFTVRALCDGAAREGTLTFDIFSELEKPLNMSINGDRNELWTVTRTDTGFKVQARRFGHGTGLSQRGAMRMGELGYTYDQILGFYFEGCRRVRYTFVRSVLSALGNGKSREQLSVDAPASLPGAAAAVGVVQMSSPTEELALRTAPDSTSAVIAGLPHGAAAALHAHAGDWCLVTYGALTGYVQASGLRRSGEPDGQMPAVTQPVQYGTVIRADHLNLRTAPDAASAIAAQVPGGACLPLLALSGGWAFTQYGVQTGYVNLEEVTRTSQYTGTARDANAAGALVTAAGGTPLYLTASLNGYQAMTAPQGALVKIKSDDGSWCQVWFAGFTGYMLSSALARNGMTVDEVEDSPKAGEFTAAVSSVSTVNLREKPGLDSPVMAVISRDDPVIVTGASGAWYSVRWHGVDGWCMAQYLAARTEVLPMPTAVPESTVQPEPAASPAPEQTVTYAKVTTPEGSLNLRKRAASSAVVLAHMPSGEMVQVVEKGENWTRVIYRERAGYARTEFLAFVEVPVPVLPTAAAGGSSAQVNTEKGALNLRKQASSGAKVLAAVPQYAYVSVLSRGEKWTQVVYNDKTGYVMTKFLRFAEGEAPAVLPTAEAPVLTPLAAPVAARVTAAEETVPLRTAASENTVPLALITRGEYVRVTARGPAWCAAEYEGMIGYLPVTCLEMP